MKTPKFIHLRTHSEYSILEGALRIKSYPKYCADRDFPAIALTDTNNVFGALNFGVTLSTAGIQPIIGIEIQTNFHADKDASKQNARKLKAPSEPMVFLAQNEQGYQNLLKMQSYYYLHKKGARSPLPIEVICELNQGLIALTGGALGPIARKISQTKWDEAEADLLTLKAAFANRLYIEIERHAHGAQSQTEAERLSENGLISLAYAHDLPLVATNNAHFPSPELFESQDALLCIADGQFLEQTSARRQLTENHDLKSQNEMAMLFADLPEALENSVEIAKRCAFMPKSRAPILPKFAENEVEELRRQAYEGLEKRLSENPLFAPREAYFERLDYELSVIEKMGFPGYFLIVADFIAWAKSQSIPVGPGRGSGAGSLVAYALTITNLDPLQFSLLFERFLNPERVSMPDFDIDFCQARRDEVIDYVQNKYGHDRVSGINTFGALMSKAAIRDVGRVLQMPYSQVDRLSKLVPLDGTKPLSIEAARKAEPLFDEEAKKEEVIEQMLDLATKIEGLYRNISTHAAGVVIADRPIDELVPLYLDPRSTMPNTGFEMKWAEAAGLVKFDFLGLANLTVIDNTLSLLKKRGIELNIDHIPLDDKKTYELYAQAQTIGVFQVESPGMRDALRQLKPNCLEDIVALVALYRPGPMENIPKFCKVKNGEEQRDYIHSLIDNILDETQGIIVYQEQVMEIAQKMGGYSLGGADLLRRAMGKKIKEDMDKERPKFIEGAKAQNVDEKLASEVFDLLEKFANYGFNKSHAAAYALISYQTAYLKANYPVEFLAAAMNNDMNNTDKLAIFKAECDRLGIETVPASINQSEARFDVKDGKVLYALAALKNVGTEAMKSLVQARGDTPFLDMIDFAKRVELRKIGKRALEMMARAGVFDELGVGRQSVLENLDALMNYSHSYFEEKQSAQNSLFVNEDEALPPPRWIQGQILTPTQILEDERLAIGFYLSGHPMDSYYKVLKRHNIPSLKEMSVQAELSGYKGRVAGIVSALQIRTNKKGKKFAFVRISDASDSYEFMLFSELLEKFAALLEIGNKLVLQVSVEKTEDRPRANIQHILPLDSLEYDQTKQVVELELVGIQAVDGVYEAIKNLPPSVANGEIRAKFDFDNHLLHCSLIKDVPLSAEAHEILKNLPGVLAFDEL